MNSPKDFDNLQLPPMPSLSPSKHQEAVQNDRAYQYLDSMGKPIECDPDLQKKFDEIESLTEENIKHQYEIKRKKFKRYTIVEGERNPVPALPYCPKC